MSAKKGYRRITSALWVSSDGSYGSGDVLMVDTTLWTDQDFDDLDCARDSEKMDLAKRIQRKRYKEYKNSHKKIDMTYEDLEQILKSADSLEIKVFRIDEYGVEEITDREKNKD